MNFIIIAVKEKIVSIISILNSFCKLWYWILLWKVSQTQPNKWAWDEDPLASTTIRELQCSKQHQVGKQKINVISFSKIKYLFSILKFFGYNF